MTMFASNSVDRCHVQLFKHPARRRQEKLQKAYGAITGSEETYAPFVYSDKYLSNTFPKEKRDVSDDKKSSATVSETIS